MTIEIDVEIDELPQLLIEIARLISEGLTSGYLLDGYWSIQKIRQNYPRIRRCEGCLMNLVTDYNDKSSLPCLRF